MEHAGTASYYRVNDDCLTEFPAAADVVMGRLPRATAVVDAVGGFAVLLAICKPRGTA